VSLGTHHIWEIEQKLRIRMNGRDLKEEGGRS